MTPRDLRDTSSVGGVTPDTSTTRRPVGAIGSERLFDSLDVHASSQPAAVAVEGSGNAWSYADLAVRSRAVAALLSRHGIQRGDRVAVLGSKSPALVAVLYGILRVGAAYVPLSLDWPPERVHWILRDVAAAGIVMDEAHALAFPEGSPPVFWIDGDATSGVSLRAALAGGVAAKEEPDDEAPVTAEDLSYVIYTSGSTGNPKGVMHSHASALAFVRWAASALALGPSDRLASHAPFHFDLSIFDLYAASHAGAAVVLSDDGVTSVPARFVGWLREQEITTVYSVPGLWIAVLGQSRTAFPSLPALRRIIYAGEAMAPKYVSSLQRTLPRVEIHNFYGPTETNVCTAYQVPPLDPERLPAAIPIGNACSGDTVSVDDGELVVRGESLLLGYWGKPRRGPDEPYRTGDLVRYDAELGGYVFLGRRDGMRKVRGFRVELGEIEACLLKNPAVGEAVVSVDTRDPGHATLVAFVVPAEGAQRDAMELRRHCALFLPPYMVPKILWCERMPRTSTGKVDRRALEQTLSPNPLDEKPIDV